MDFLKDDVKKVFYKFLIPAVSSTIAVAAYSLVDTIAIGQGVGPDGTAACALVLPIFSIANFIALLCGIGGSVLMTRARGSGHPQKGDGYFSAAIVLLSVLTLVAWIFGWTFQREFYLLCGADEKLLPYAMDYGTWIFAFTPTFAAAAFLEYFICADGAPRFAMCVTLIGGAVNMLGDWLFVFPLGMGMAGAGMATAFGSAVQTLLLLGYILLKKTSLHLAKPGKWFPALKEIAVTGFSAGINSLAVIAISFIANNQIMQYAGSASLAVYGVLGTVAAVFTSIFSGVGQATQPIVSANMGAKQYARSWQAGSLGIGYALLFGTIFALVSILFPVGVAKIFMKMTPEVEAVTPYIMRVFSAAYIPQALCVFSVFFLQSMARPHMATVISLLRGLVLSGGFLLLFPLIWGGHGIWWAFLAAELVTMLLAILYLFILRRRSCKEKALL